MRKVLFFLLALVMLTTACTAPAGQAVSGETAAPTGTPMATAAPSDTPMTAAAKPSSIPTLVPPDTMAPLSLREQLERNLMGEDLLPNTTVISLPEGRNLFYVMDAPSYAGKNPYPLSGPAKSKADLEFLQQSLLLGVYLKDLQAALAEQEIMVELDLTLSSYQNDITISHVTYSEAFDRKYAILSATYGFNGVDIIFMHQDGNYTPHVLIPYMQHGESSACLFEEFAGQEWVLYPMLGTGAEYSVTVLFWYNLSTRKLELSYLHAYFEAGNIANTWERQLLRCGAPTVKENEYGFYLESLMHIQVEAQEYFLEYNDEGEAIEPLPLPENDHIAYRVYIKIYYDEKKHAFYVRIPREAYVLDDGNRKKWLYYVDDYMKDLIEHGNSYQKRWAESFYSHP